MSNLFNSMQRQVDRVGIALSGLCALHCVATIFIISGLGIGGHFLSSPLLHEVGLVVAVLVAAVAIGWGALQHRQPAAFAVAMTGLSFMGGALAAPHGVYEAALTIIGVVLVSLGHILNLRLRH